MAEQRDTDRTVEAIGLSIVHKQMDRLARLQERGPKPVPLAQLEAREGGAL